MATDTEQLTFPASLEGWWYTEPAIFAEEQRAIYGQRWVCVARADEVPAAGDFLVREVGGESLIILRDDEGALGAYYNVCRHRGARLLTDAAGHCGGVIRCPYHAWAYGLDGALRAAPNMPDWRRERWTNLGLHAVAVSEELGCVWVNLADEPGAWDDDIGRQIRSRMGSDELMSTWAMPSLVTGTRRVYEAACNWKLIVENFSECYHCPSVHPELTTVLPEFKRGKGTLHQAGYGAAYGEDIGGFTFDGRPGLPPLPGLSAEDGRRYYGLVLTPNVFLNLVGDHVILHWLEPIGPDRTRIVCHWLFDPAVLEAGYDVEPSVELFHRTNLQDFAICERCQLGMSSRSFAHGGNLVETELQLRDFHAEVRAAVGDAGRQR
jgi:Rieske 2Fe-2S family protein